MNSRSPEEARPAQRAAATCETGLLPCEAVLPESFPLPAALQPLPSSARPSAAPAAAGREPPVVSCCSQTCSCQVMGSLGWGQPRGTGNLSDVI